MNAWRCAHRAFTLIELLVVVSLIVLLIAMLLPALGRARGIARAVSCSSNLHQIAAAATDYGTDNGYHVVGIASSGGTWIWPTLLRGQMGGSTEPFHCPAADDRTKWEVVINGGGDAVHGYLDGERRLAPGGQTDFSYGYNVWGSHVGRVMNTGLGTYDGHATFGNVRVGRVKNPPRMVQFADSNYDVDLNWSGFVGLEAPRQYPSQIHEGRANVSFVDGHTERLLPEDISDHWNADVNRIWNIHNEPMFGAGGTR